VSAHSFYVEAGRARRRVGRLWIPDGLHVWWRSRGVHVFWSSWPPVGFDHDPDWNRDV
jgi:hypothetical protein